MIVLKVMELIIDIFYARSLHQLCGSSSASLLTATGLLDHQGCCIALPAWWI